MTAQTPQKKYYLPFVSVPKKPVYLPVGPVGGTYTALAVDPVDANIVYVGNFGSGVYRSLDQGATWYAMNEGLKELRIQSLAIDPLKPTTVFAGTYGGGIYRSVDRGENWVALNAKAFAGHIVYDIEISTFKPQLILITTRKVDNPDGLMGFLYRSKDGGLNWTLLREGKVGGEPDYFYGLDIHPQTNNGIKVYLTYHRNGYYKSYDAGVTFTAVNDGITDYNARSVKIDSLVPGLVYGGGWQYPGMFRTTSAGELWEPITIGTPGLPVKVGRIVLAEMGKAWKRVFVCTAANGVMSSDNKGDTWEERGLAPMMVNDFAISKGKVEVWFAATQTHGIFRSYDLGKTWTNNPAAASHATVTSLVAFPQIEGGLLAAVPGQGVLLSEDQGRSWVEMNSGLEDLYVFKLKSMESGLYALTFDGLYRWAGGTWQAVTGPFLTRSHAPDKLDFLGKRANLQDEVLDAVITGELKVPETQRLGNSAAVLDIEEWQGSLVAATAEDGLWCQVEDAWQPCGFQGASVPLIETALSHDMLIAWVCETGQPCTVQAVTNGSTAYFGEGLEGLEVTDLLATPKGYLAATVAGLFARGWEDARWDAVPTVTSSVYSLASNEENPCLLAAGSLGQTYISEDCGDTWAAIPAIDPAAIFQAAAFLGDTPAGLFLGSRTSGVFQLEQ